MFVDIFNTTKKFGVIYADPPWAYDNKIGGNGSNVKSKYKTMTNQEIKDLPIKKLLKKDAICFLWTTDAYLEVALEVLRSWGFNYKTIGFVWLKLTNTGKHAYVQSPYTSKSSEICLLGTKGAITKHMKSRNQRQLIIEERREHSRKPDEAYERIEAMFGKAKYLELFARNERDGWDCYGDDEEIL